MISDSRVKGYDHGRQGVAPNGDGDDRYLVGYRHGLKAMLQYYRANPTDRPIWGTNADAIRYIEERLEQTS